MDTTSILIYAVLFLASALYAAFLERHKERWEPDYTWLEVVIGTALCLASATAQRRWGGATTAASYEQAVWLSFVVGGSPVILWQIGRAIASQHETISYKRGSHDTSKEMAEEM